MTSIAFYAPLKTPNHPTPSGDRQIARNLISALAHGFDASVTLASELRSFEPVGDADTQARITAEAQAECQRILQDLPRPAMWVTYHNYYKAPDLIGPAMSRTWSVPYVQIEASRARSRLSGPWARFAQAAHEASDAADVIFHVTQDDLVALERDRHGMQHIVELPPFLDRDTLPAASDLSGPMLSVGMMRHGDKLASYQVMAEALSQISSPDWRLDIAGDGPARPAVETLFAPFADRVRFLGTLTPDELAQAYGRASLFLWPGVNEAYGMVYLEAQAHGLPVAAQDRPGVRDVLLAGSYPAADDGPAGLAQLIDSLLSDAALRHQLGARAQTHVKKRHLRPSAIQVLRETLTPFLEATP